MQVGPRVNFPGAVSGPARCLTGLLVVGGYETINPDEDIRVPGLNQVLLAVLALQCPLSTNINSMQSLWSIVYGEVTTMGVWQSTSAEIWFPETNQVKHKAYTTDIRFFID